MLLQLISQQGDLSAAVGQLQAGRAQPPVQQLLATIKAMLSFSTGKVSGRSIVTLTIGLKLVAVV